MASKRRPVPWPGCVRRIKKRHTRKRNPSKRNPSKWYVLQRRGRTKFYYDVTGHFTVMGEPKGFRSIEEARAEFEGVRYKPKRLLRVTNEKPPHARR